MTELLRRLDDADLGPYDDLGPSGGLHEETRAVCEQLGLRHPPYRWRGAVRERLRARSVPAADPRERQGAARGLPWLAVDMPGWGRSPPGSGSGAALGCG